MDVSDWAAVATMIVATITILGVLTKRIEKLDGRIDKVETNLDAKIDRTREELQASIETVRSESRADIADLRHEFRFLSRTIVDFLAHPPQRTATSSRE